MKSKYLAKVQKRKRILEVVESRMCMISLLSIMAVVQLTVNHGIYG